VRPALPLLQFPQRIDQGDNTGSGAGERRPVGRSNLLASVQWLLLLAWSVRNTLFVRQRASSTFATIDAAAGLQVGVVGVSALVLLASGKLGALFTNSRSPLQLLLLYYALCIFSALWSPMPAYSFYRAFESLILVASAASAMMASRDQESAERTLLALALITVVLSMGQNVRLLGLSAMATLHSWHTNTYTAVAAVSLVYAFGEYRAAVGDRRKRLSRTIVWSLAAVVAGTSSASNVSTVIGLLVAAVIQRRYGLIALLLGVCFIAAVILIANEGSVFGMLSWLFPGKDEAAVESLGGRTRIWELYWASWVSRPLLGHGFGVLSLENGHAIRLYSHNAFVASILGCGVLGGLLAAGFLWRLARQALRGLRSVGPGAVGGAAALVTAVVNSNSMPLFLELWEESNLVSTALIAYLVYFVWAREPVRARRPILAGR
jgi:O-antigen ligase